MIRFDEKRNTSHDLIFPNAFEQPNVLAGRMNDHYGAVIFADRSDHSAGGLLAGAPGGWAGPGGNRSSQLRLRESRWGRSGSSAYSSHQWKFVWNEFSGRLRRSTAYDKRIAQAAGSTLADYSIVKIPVYMTDDEQALYDTLGDTLREYMAKKGKDKPGYGMKELSKDSSRDLNARRALRAYHKRLSMEDRAEGKLRAVEDVFQMQPDRPTIIFTGTNAMAREVSLKFMIPCLLSHCAKEERDWIFTGFKQEKFKAVVACQILDEGVDFPNAKVGIILGGSTSILKAEQRLGRLLRRTGNVPATLYEVFCQDTSEVLRSRKRRKSDAYQARG